MIVNGKDAFNGADRGRARQSIDAALGRARDVRLALRTDQGNAELLAFCATIANVRPHPRWPQRRVDEVLLEEQSRLLALPDPLPDAAFDLVHEGALGAVRKVVVHDGHYGPKEIGVEPEFLAWLTDPKLNGGGALFDFGCYGADLMTWLMDGQRPQTVTAVTKQIKPEIYPRVDDEATIVLTYPKAQAIVQASWNWPFSRKDMEVYGQTGYVITVKNDLIRVRRGGGPNGDESQEE